MAASEANRSLFDIPLPALIISGGLHLLIPISLIILQILNFLEIPIYPTEKSKKAIYQSFIQVDVVALPDQTEAEVEKFDPLAKIANANKVPTVPKEPVMTIPKKKPKPKPKPKPKKKVLKKEKQAALDALKAQLDRESALKKLAVNQNKSKTRKVIKGNIKSKGTSQTGMLGNAKDRYTDIVHQSIKKHFSVFAWDKKKGLVSIVRIEILENGRVRNIKSIRNSGNPSYEAAVRTAIRSASKDRLPLPLDMSLLQGGLTLEFRSKE